jgi:hypothetical protein
VSGVRHLVLTAAAVTALALVFGGCAAPAGGVPARMPAGRVLVVPRAEGPEQAPVAELAAQLFLDGLRSSTAVVGVREFLREAEVLVPPPWGARFLARLAAGGWPTPEEGVRLAERFGVAAIVAVEVTTYDQVWGKYAKFTRVGVDTTAFDVLHGEVRWKLHRDVELEDKRGRAFRLAMEEAVGDLTGSIDPRWRFSLVDAWRSWRR